MEFKNNVTRILDSQNVSYKVHHYDYDAGIHSATEVADAIGLPREQVFKTLVAIADDQNRKPALVILPGVRTMNLKTLAQAIGVKKARMATHEQAEHITGLQTGGISPLALINKRFDVYIDEAALHYEHIAVSAGQRGANIELRVTDLINLTGAAVIAL